MTADTIAIIVTLALFGLTHTVILVRWGTRLQSMVERHHESLHGERGLHAWRHDVVTPRLYAIDDLLERVERVEKKAP